MKTPWHSDLATVLNTAMEATWLSVLLLAISYTLAEPGVVMLGLPLFLFLYAARLVVRGLLHSHVDLAHSRLLLICAVIASLLLVLKLQNYPSFSPLSAAWLKQLLADMTTLAPPLGSVIMTLITVVWVWWRALQSPKGSEVARYYFRQFQAGLGVVIAISLLGSRVGLASVFVPWILWFFFWGLLSIAVNRLDEIARDRGIAVAGYWLPIILAIAVLVVGAGVLMSAVFAQGIFEVFRSLFASLGPLLSLLATIIAFPIGLLAEVLIIVLRPILQPLIGLVMAVASVLSSPQNPLAGLINEAQRRVFTIPPLAKEALRWSAVALILSAILVALALALRRRQAESAADPDEVHESVFSAAELAAGLRMWWQTLLRRLRHSRSVVASRVLAPASDDERSAHSVRQIYVRLLEMTAGLGRPRPVAVTPYEYLADLVSLLPASSPDLATITDAYVSARYGVAGASAAQLSAVQQAWQRVKSEGSHLRPLPAANRAKPQPSDVPGDEFVVPEYMIKEIRRRKRGR